MNNLDRQNYRNNCLNTIRLIAAVSVFYIHAIAHLQVEMPESITKIIAFFQGVPIFFAMSGFLVWDSVGRSDGFANYLRKRFFRIYPELWCAVLLSLGTIIVLYDAPIAWGQLGVFAVTQGTVIQFWTPDFLRGYGCGTPNGTLWTIGVMVQFYIVIYFAYKLLKNKSLRFWIALFVGAALIELLSPLIKGLLPNIIYKLYRQTLIPHMWLFVLGVLIAAKREIVLPFLRKYWVAFLLVSAICMFAGIDMSMGDYGLLSSTTVCLGMIGLAYQFPKLNIRTDISYGVYIYHMIVINAMIALGFTKDKLHLLIALLVTGLLAVASEKTVGRFAMHLKVHK